MSTPYTSRLDIARGLLAAVAPAALLGAAFFAGRWTAHVGPYVDSPPPSLMLAQPCPLARCEAESDAWLWLLDHDIGANPRCVPVEGDPSTRRCDVPPTLDRPPFTLLCGRAGCGLEAGRP